MTAFSRSRNALGAEAKLRGPRAVADAAEPASQNGNGSSEVETETLKRRLLRLALDVHDGPMQNLAVIGLSLNNLRRRIETLVPDQHHTKLNQSVEQIASELGQVEHELRTLISALEDGATESIPVLEAVETEIREFTRRSDAKIELVAEGAVQAYTDSQRIALQAIARSALANVAKHAEAKKVTVRLYGSPDTITLEIEDDGRGFAADAPPKPGRFGLVGMRDRAELLGGDLRIDSRPGGPTIVTATLLTWRPPIA